jgi:hypothetical protein
MSKPAGKCVFCGRRGLTKGHVWPDWLSEILPPTASHHVLETGKTYTFTPVVPGPIYSKRRRQGHAGSRKPRNTCGECNSGWMSVIEGSAKPYAVPLIQNVPFLLDTIGQRTLASLLCLIAMRYELLGDMRAVSVSERDWLRYYREPSEDWKIWIAHYGGGNQDDHWARQYGAQLDSRPTDKVGPEYCNVQVTTLVIGQLCAHIFYSPVIDFLGYEGIAPAQIWPRRRFDFDTCFLPTMGDEHVIWLHEAFPRESRPMPTETTLLSERSGGADVGV